MVVGVDNVVEVVVVEVVDVLGHPVVVVVRLVVVVDVDDVVEVVEFADVEGRLVVGVVHLVVAVDVDVVDVEIFSCCWC